MKNKFKNSISIILTVCIMFFTLISPALAQNIPYTDAVIKSENDRYTVSLYIRNSKNIDGLDFTIKLSEDGTLSFGDIKVMLLQSDDISNQIRNTIRDYAYEHGLAFYNIRNHEGLLRNLMIRTSSTGELMVLLQVRVSSDKDLEETKELLAHVADKFPQITSLLYVVNNKCNDTINDLDVEVFKGNDHIFEEMEGLRFKVGPKSFYQTNSEQAYNLYKVARDFAGLTGDELVYDLYTGTGTIANFVSRQAKKVVGIE